MSTAEDTLADELIESKRKFFTELIHALDLVDSKKLIGCYMLSHDGLYCAIGAMAAARGIDPVSLSRLSGKQISEKLDCSWRGCWSHPLPLSYDQVMTKLKDVQ